VGACGACSPDGGTCACTRTAQVRAAPLATISRPSLESCISAPAEISAQIRVHCFAQCLECADKNPIRPIEQARHAPASDIRQPARVPAGASHAATGISELAGAPASRDVGPAIVAPTGSLMAPGGRIAIAMERMGGRSCTRAGAPWEQEFCGCLPIAIRDMTVSRWEHAENANSEAPALARLPDAWEARPISW
jgi:hypothetical protein